QTPDLLTLTRNDLMREDPEDVAVVEQPDAWRADDLSLPLTYRFEPGAEDDGVTVHVPVEVLARLGGDEFSWQVPALREELVTALIRSLPKDLRRNFVPAPDTARAVLAAITPGDEPLLEAIQRELYRRTRVLVPIDAFDLDKLPSHLRFTFAVESADGTEVARGKDLEGLQKQLDAPIRRAVAEAVAGDVERTGLRAWPDDLDELTRTVERTSGGHAVRGFPALVDAGGAVDVRVFPTQVEQDAVMGSGSRRLLRLSVPSPVKTVERQLDPRIRLVLGANPDGSLQALLDDCADAATDALAPTPAWTRVDFTALRDRLTRDLASTTARIVGDVEKVLAAYHEVQLALPGAPPPGQVEAIADIRAQLERLLPSGFVTATGAARLADLTRYLTAIGRRLDRLAHNLGADRERMQQVHAVTDAYEDLVGALSPARAAAADIRDIARMIEELRVSLWAQQLGTTGSVSEQRIYRAIDAIAP
ncbi:MAG: ATP-dependent helicase HrpA, partial [Mycobacterium sp.]|nr:ATP-dependent helicase HrpA [Mycobacterium sp.]